MRTSADPITALVKLRAAIVRLSHDADGIAEARNAADMRRKAHILADNMRLLAVAPEMVSASARPREGAP